LVTLGSAFTVAFFVTLKLHYDNLQILDKAIALVDEGRWSHVGNVATGVGLVPGTFQTVITALPMMLWFSPYAALAVVALFHLASLGLLALVARDLDRPWIFLDLALLYWVNPWRVEQSQLYNPAYLLFFSALHFWTAYRMRVKSPGLTAAHVLAVGFCAQVHFSFVILAILSLILWRLRYLRVHWGGVLVGAVLVGASLVPYAMEYARSPEAPVDLLGEAGRFPGRNVLLVFPVLKALAYWIRYGSTYFARPLFSEIDLGWLAKGVPGAAAAAAFAALKWPLAGVTLLLSAAVTVSAFAPVWRSRPFSRVADRTQGSPAERIALYAFYMLAAMLVAVGLSPVQPVHWHLLLCFPVVATLVTIRFNALRDHWPGRRIALAFGAVLAAFMVFNTLGFMGSRAHSYQSDFHRDFVAYYRLTRSTAPPAGSTR
jgi:hypothetical protein